MNYLVFDIGGTSVKYALSDQLGNLSHTGFFPTPGTNAKTLLQAMDDVRLRIGGKQPIDGAAVSCPGAVDPVTGVVHGTSAVPCIHGIPLREMLSGRFGVCLSQLKMMPGVLRGENSGEAWLWEKNISRQSQLVAALAEPWSMTEM